MLLFLAAVSALMISSGVHADSRTGHFTFREAKDFLRSQVFKPGMPEYYCGCTIVAEGKKWSVDLASCGYQVRKNAERAARIEFEHIVPAADFGRQRGCWQQGGRKNCAETDPVFSAMEGDPHNLIPVIGEVNADRGALGYGMLGSGQGMGYGQCPSRVDFKARTFMPPRWAMGDIARTNFYFRDRYGLRLSKSQEQLFTAWNAIDPVDQFECWKNQRIAAATGVGNPHVASGCR